MPKLDSQLWAGTEAALMSYFENEKRVDAVMASMGAAYASQTEDTPELPRLFSKVGDIGVIKIAGSLVNSDSWMNQFLGRTGYGEIREALVHAANDASVKAVVLDISSGGGMVAGVTDASDLVKRVDTQAKPVHMFTDSMAASAAYWVGSGARSITAGRVAELGSIGVIQIHKEYSKMLEQEGVKVTVLKAGEFKGQGNPYEPLTDKVKAEMQSQVDHVASIFVQTVAENRKVSYPEVDQKMGQGRMFVGTQAVDVGLADAVSTFDALLSKLQGEIDLQKSSLQYGGSNFQKGSAMKTALTEQQLAVMALAGNLPAAQAQAETPTDAPAAPAAEQAPATAPEAPATAPEAPAAEAAAPAQKESELVGFLKTSLAEAQASVVDLTVQLRDVKAAGEKMNSTHAAMRSIVEASVSQLKVALGGSAGAVDALADDALLAEHASLRAQFESKFKAGGVAAVSSTGSSDKVSEVVDPVRQARMASTRPAK